MTCAPRGISSTYSASVGRSATSRAPIVVRTVMPSGCPMRSSWRERRRRGSGTRHPPASVMRCRRRLASTSSTRSPATSGPVHRSRHPRRRVSVDRLTRPRARADGRTRTRRRASARRTTRTASSSSRSSLDVGRRSARGPRSRKPNRNAAFVPGERSSSVVEHLLVPEVAVARGHRALLDLVVDPAEHAVRGHLALAEPDQRLDLAREARRGRAAPGAGARGTRSPSAARCRAARRPRRRGCGRSRRRRSRGRARTR